MRQQVTRPLNILVGADEAELVTLMDFGRSVQEEACFAAAAQHHGIRARAGSQIQIGKRAASKAAPRGDLHPHKLNLRERCRQALKRMATLNAGVICQRLITVFTQVVDAALNLVRGDTPGRAGCGA